MSARPDRRPFSDHGNDGRGQNTHRLGRRWQLLRALLSQAFEAIGGPKGAAFGSCLRLLPLAITHEGVAFSKRSALQKGAALDRVPFGRYAEAYDEHRPSYPPAMFAKIAACLPAQSPSRDWLAAIDVACGTGRGAFALASAESYRVARVLTFVRL